MGFPDWSAYPTFNATLMTMHNAAGLNTIREAQPDLQRANPTVRVNNFNRRLQQEVEASTAGVDPTDPSRGRELSTNSATGLVFSSLADVTAEDLPIAENAVEDDMAGSQPNVRRRLTSDTASTSQTSYPEVDQTGNFIPGTVENRCGSHLGSVGTMGSCDFASDVRLDQFPVPPGCAYAVAAVAVPTHAIRKRVQTSSGYVTIILAHGTYRDGTVAHEDAAWLVAFAGNGTSKIVRYHSWNNSITYVEGQGKTMYAFPAMEAIPSAVATDGTYAYFGVQTNPGKIYKFVMAYPEGGLNPVDALTLPTGFDQVWSLTTSLPLDKYHDLEDNKANLPPDMLFVGTKSALVQVKLNIFNAIAYISMPGGTDGTALTGAICEHQRTGVFGLASGKLLVVNIGQRARTDASQYLTVVKLYKPLRHQYDVTASNYTTSYWTDLKIANCHNSAYWAQWVEGYKYPVYSGYPSTETTEYTHLDSANAKVLGTLRYFTRDGNKTGAFIAMRWFSDDKQSDPTLHLEQLVYFSSPAKSIHFFYQSVLKGAQDGAALYNVDVAKIAVVLQQSALVQVPHFIYSAYDWTRESSFSPSRVQAFYQQHFQNSAGQSSGSSATVTTGPVAPSPSSSSSSSSTVTQGPGYVDPATQNMYR